MTNRRPLIALLFAAALGASRALSLGRNPKTTSRLSFVRETVVGAFGASIFASAAVVPAPANADSALPFIKVCRDLGMDGPKQQ